MNISVKLFAVFQEGRFADRDMQFASPITVEEVIDNLGLSRSPIGFIVINGAMSRRDAALSDGDELAIFPMMGGG